MAISSDSWTCPIPSASPHRKSASSPCVQAAPSRWRPVHPHHSTQPCEFPLPQLSQSGDKVHSPASCCCFPRLHVFVCMQSSSFHCFVVSEVSYTCLISFFFFLELFTSISFLLWKSLLVSSKFVTSDLSAGGVQDQILGGIEVSVIPVFC